MRFGYYYTVKEMLSKSEIEFLKNPANFSPDYVRVLRHRLKVKTAQIRDELSLLKSSGLNVMENCNGVTEFCNGNQSLNQSTSANQGLMWSLRRDLDPRPLPYQGNAPPG